MTDLFTFSTTDPILAFLNTRISGDLTVGVLGAIIIGLWVASMYLGK